ncbi:hypothetical protein HanIR_Chr06g0266471 [Helianthus annuus]|nr:hypothetical protein HanIR_Chr06g0266471 [Helianthus annuus]
MQRNNSTHDLQLEAAKLAKKKLCCCLDVLFEEFLFLFVMLEQTCTTATVIPILNPISGVCKTWFG